MSFAGPDELGVHELLCKVSFSALLLIADSNFLCAQGSINFYLVFIGCCSRCIAHFCLRREVLSVFLICSNKQANVGSSDTCFVTEPKKVKRPLSRVK
jgi:hypothetical protein